MAFGSVLCIWRQASKTSTCGLAKPAGRSPRDGVDDRFGLPPMRLSDEMRVSAVEILHSEFGRALRCCPLGRTPWPDRVIAHHPNKCNDLENGCPESALPQAMRVGWALIGAMATMMIVISAVSSVDALNKVYLVVASFCVSFTRALNTQLGLPARRTGASRSAALVARSMG